MFHLLPNAVDKWSAPDLWQPHGVLILHTSLSKGSNMWIMILSVTAENIVNIAKQNYILI